MNGACDVLAVVASFLRTTPNVGQGVHRCKHQRLKHATACRNLPPHLFLGPVGGGLEACRSMPQHTENWGGTFWGKKSDQNINPIPEQSTARG